METILRMVERKYGKARRIWVLDRGIVSEENLAAIRKRGGQYLVGTPRRQMKQFEEELLKDDWTRVQPEVEVKRVAIPQAEETYILCRTRGRPEHAVERHPGEAGRIEGPRDGARQRERQGWNRSRRTGAGLVGREVFPAHALA